jgi:hypothetical protein
MYSLYLSRHRIVSDALLAKAREVPVPTPTFLAYRVGTLALVGSSQDF